MISVMSICQKEGIQMENLNSVSEAYQKFEKFLIEMLGGNYNSYLFGYKVICKIEEYIKNNPEIKVVHCDDDVFASSIIVLIPHPTRGITVKFIPQCTELQNTFFLYDRSYEKFVETLNEMKSVYIVQKEKTI